MDKIKINSLELENVKRIKAVQIEPSENGLTIIGGNNNNGKTSVLDAITWCLGGNKYKPSKPTREGSYVPASLKVTLSNGIVVERKGKNSALKVTDPTGMKAGQSLLDSFISELALNLPKFMNSSEKEKADTLLHIIGIGDELTKLDLKEKAVYNDRLAIGRIADQKSKHAKEMVHYDNVPDKIVSASELIAKQQEMLAINGSNERKRAYLAECKSKSKAIEEKMNDLDKQLKALNEEYLKVIKERDKAVVEVSGLVDNPTDEIERSIKEIDDINIKVRTNLEKKKAEQEANDLKKEYASKSQELEDIRKEKASLLNNADLPLEGLGIENGKITYLNQEWDNMSGSQQLKVATAICRKINPNCGFILLDKLEQMDMNTLTEFGTWLKSEGLQAIATRVSTGDECSIIIEDGYVAKNNLEKEKKEEAKEEPKAVANSWEGVKW